MKNIFFLLLACTLTSATAQTSRLETFLRDSLDIQMQRALAQWQVPGAAVCVVKGDTVLLAKGYGVRTLDTRQPVDEHTLFMIGSNTKAFTGTALAWLEHDKECTLDDRVQQWLPGFTMKDPWVASHLTLTDILCHRMGMETFQGDFSYWTSNLSADEVISTFGKFQPLYDFRTKWGYTNAGFSIAGSCIRNISGQSWADFLKTRIFQPLDMNRTVALSAEAMKANNMAQPYSKIDGQLTAIPFAIIDNLAPAGSIGSSVSDLSHWLIAQLNEGRYNGKEVLPPAVIRRTRQPESIIGRSRSEGAHYQLYGLGWELQDYHGRELVSHTGGVNGFVTAVTLIPEEQTGIVVLTNTDANGLYQAMNKILVDAALNLPYKDHSARYLKGYADFEADNLKQEKTWRDSAALHLPTAMPLAAYTGRYQHDAYGWIELEADGKNLKMRFQHHNMTARLEPLGGNRFLCTYSDRTMGIRVIPFRVENGKVTSLTLTVADFVEFTPYTFVKR